MLLKPTHGHEKVNVTGLYLGAENSLYASIPRPKMEKGEFFSSDGTLFGTYDSQTISDVPGNEENLLRVIKVIGDITQRVNDLLKQYPYLSKKQRLHGTGYNSDKIVFIGNEYCGKMSNLIRSGRNHLNLSYYPVYGVWIEEALEKIRESVKSEIFLGLPVYTLDGELHGPALFMTDKDSKLNFYNPIQKLEDTLAGRHLGLRELD